METNTEQKIRAVAGLSLIVAVAGNGAIGKDNNLLWHISEDLKRFKALTSGHTVIMGRKTYLSFPKRPLPNRFHIVLSRKGLPEEDAARAEVVCAGSVEEALEAVPAGDNAFVIGGGSVYAQFLPFCERAFVTEVDADFEADTFFPALDPAFWQVGTKSEWMSDAKSGLRFRYVDYKRI